MLSVCKECEKKNKRYEPSNEFCGGEECDCYFCVNEGDIDSLCSICRHEGSFKSMVF